MSRWWAEESIAVPFVYIGAVVRSQWRFNPNRLGRICFQGWKLEENRCFSSITFRTDKVAKQMIPQWIGKEQSDLLMCYMCLIGTGFLGVYKKEVLFARLDAFDLGRIIFGAFSEKWLGERKQSSMERQWVDKCADLRDVGNGVRIACLMTMVMVDDGNQG